jgi:hypothetical protein
MAGSAATAAIKEGIEKKLNVKILCKLLLALFLSYTSKPTNCLHYEKRI